MARATPLLVGDPAPWFRHRCTTPHGTHTFDMAAGRNVVLYFFPTSTDPRTAAALAAIRDARVRRARRLLLRDQRRSGRRGAAGSGPPGIRFFLGGDGKVASLFGRDPESSDGLWYVLDRLLRARGVLAQADDAAGRVLASLAALGQVGPEQHAVAPALVLPDVVEPAFCDRPIAHYHAGAKSASGVMTQTVDGGASRVVRRVVPEIRKCFQFEAVQLDRPILACCNSDDGGRFGAHRDNTVAAAAHRRFALSINTNDDFEGGELIFPEFGARRYRPEVGGTVVVSCSLMHAVTPVTKGKRFACLPFVCDEAAAVIKRANQERRPGALPLDPAKGARP